MSGIRFVIVALCVVTVCAVISLVGTRIVIAFGARGYLMDVPNPRSSHSAPTPRGGGFAIAVTVTIGTYAIVVFLPELHALLGVLWGAIIVATIGFVDDLRNVSPWLRLLVQSIASVVVILGGVALTQGQLAGIGMSGTLLADALAVLLLVWATNLFNFMDGIDGLAGSEAVFITGAGATINWFVGGSPGLSLVLLAVCGASLGFLYWNCSPARIFMGDVGSGFLGFIVAGLGIGVSDEGHIPIETWAVLAGVFLVDSTITLVRRAIRGQRVLESHRCHGYQRLADKMGAHRPVVLGTNLINCVWLFPCAVFIVFRPEYAKIAMTTALTPLIIFAFWLNAGHQD